MCAPGHAPPWAPAYPPTPVRMPNRGCGSEIAKCSSGPLRSSKTHRVPRGVPETRTETPFPHPPDAHDRPPSAECAVWRARFRSYPQRYSPWRCAHQTRMECPRTFRNLEPKHHSITHLLRMTAHQVPNVQFGELVFGHILNVIALGDEHIHQFLSIRTVHTHLYPHKNPRLVGIRIAVVELGNIAPPQGPTKLFIGARTLGNGDRQYRLALFADLRALRDIAQSVKVDIRAGINGNEGLAGAAIFLGVLLHTRYTHRARWLGDGTGIFKYVFNTRTDLIRADGDDTINGVFNDAVGFLANLRHRDAVGKNAHLRQGHPALFLQRRFQTSGLIRFHRKHLNFRAHVLHIGGNTRA